MGWDVSDSVAVEEEGGGEETPGVGEETPGVGEETPGGQRTEREVVKGIPLSSTPISSRRKILFTLQQFSVDYQQERERWPGLLDELIAHVREGQRQNDANDEV